MCKVGTTATVAGFTSAAPLVDRLLGRLGSLLATGGGIDGSLCVEVLVPSDAPER